MLEQESFSTGMPTSTKKYQWSSLMHVPVRVLLIDPSVGLPLVLTSAIAMLLLVSLSLIQSLFRRLDSLYPDFRERLSLLCQGMCMGSGLKLIGNLNSPCRVDIWF